MRHEALPQSMTAEQLGVWLADNNIDKKFHNEETPYTDEEIIEFEHKSSVASRALDRLKDIEDDIKMLLKDGCEDPVEKIIPPTKGRKVLEANRKFADAQIEKGVLEQEIALYGVPFSKTGLILYFDVEGNVWDDYQLEMTPEQREQYMGLFEQDKVEMKVVVDDDIQEDAVDTADIFEKEKVTEEEVSDEDHADTTDDVVEEIPEEDEKLKKKGAKEKDVEADAAHTPDGKDSIISVESIDLAEENLGGGKEIF